MGRAHPETKARHLSAVSFFIFIVLCLSLFRMQILRGGYYRALSQKNHIRLVYLEAPRGRILDRNGKTIATSRLSFNCTAFLRESKTHVLESIRRLGPLLGEKAGDLQARYQKKRAGVYNSVLLAEDLSPEKAMAVEQELYRLPGILVETRPVREYPLGEAAAHLTGFIGPQMASEVEELEDSGYRSSDWIGRDGLEKYYESVLKGRSGGLQLEVNHRGQYQKVLGVKEPEEGRPIELTIDAELQEFAHRQLKGRRGAVIVMELEEGGILALNSSPSYDPNLFASSKGRQNVDPYLSSPDSPMLDRCIQGQYPPGSIFKIITGLAALEARKIKPSAVFQCPGFYQLGDRLFKCWKEKGHGPQGLSEAYAHSCDVFFYLTGLAAGPDRIAKKAAEFGFASLTGIDLPGEKKGLVPSVAWKEKTLHQSWYDGDTLNFAIGQGYLQITPLQALVMIAAVATDGEFLRPHLVRKIENKAVGPAPVKNLEISRANLDSIKRGLREVVESDTGTGRMARVPGLTLAGKTGTAETGREDTHAWYVGYAPAERPKIAFAVFLEYGGHGGVQAASIAKALLEKMKEEKLL